MGDRPRVVEVYHAGDEGFGGGRMSITILVDEETDEEIRGRAIGLPQAGERGRRFPVTEDEVTFRKANVAGWRGRPGIADRVTEYDDG